MSKTLNNQTVEWNQTNWRKLERRVYKLQKRIFQASSRGDLKAVSQTPKNFDEVLVRKDAGGTSSDTGKPGQKYSRS
jgi:hypothetical protein